MWSSPCGSGARVRQRSVVGSYSSWWVPATPSTFPPITWIFPPTAARATSLRASGIGAFIIQLPGDCACPVAVNASSATQIVTNCRTFKNLWCMISPFCSQLLPIQPCGGDSASGETRNFYQWCSPYKRTTLCPAFAEKPGSTMGSVRLRDMQNRLVDDEKFSAQRCFYHDAVLPINEESGNKIRHASRPLSNDAKSPAGTARWA